MCPKTTDTVNATRSLGPALKSAVGELLDQEFSYSTGHVTAILNTCLFAPSLLTFWFVNGVLDFSTAVAIGAVSGPAGLQVRLFAYVFLIPVFLLTRIVVHILHPRHRTQILSGSCPETHLLSLDWFSTGILATGLPLALQDFGPWVGTYIVFFLGVFVVPRYVHPHRQTTIKLGAIGLSTVVFLYANYGGAVAVLPHPDAILGPVATIELADETIAQLLRMVNSVIVGPILIGVFAMTMNHILTRPELADIRFVRHALPRRDPDLVVWTSAAAGTLFYLLFVAAFTGDLLVVP